MATQDPLIGKNLGKYRVLSCIGGGGMAKVYKALDTMLNREVAIKVMAPYLAYNSEFQQRFATEAAFLARLNHPNIVTVYEYDDGQKTGFPYLVMEYLPGGSLAERIKCGGKLPAPEVAGILQAIASAVDYVHQENGGQPHRDIKPSNILFDGAGRAKLADFGLIRLSQLSLTKTGQIMGTPAYMAPEQARGQRNELGPWTDVYALGIVAYEMLTGQAPFDGDTWGILNAQISQPPPPPRQLNSAIAPALDAVLLKALEKDPRGRYPSAGAFAAALQQAASLPGRPTVPVLPPSSTAHRSWARLATVIGLLVVLVLGFRLGLWLFTGRQADVLPSPTANAQFINAGSPSPTVSSATATRPAPTMTATRPPSATPPVATATGLPPSATPAIGASPTTQAEDATDGLVCLETVSVPGKADKGVTWTASITGTYGLQYESGAYSGWPSDSTPGNQGWKTTIFGYKNRPIDWQANPDPKNPEPSDPDIRVGWDSWQPTQQQAQDATLEQRLEPEQVDMGQWEPVRFVAIDGQKSYHSPADNRGTVVVRIGLLAADSPLTDPISQTSGYLYYCGSFAPRTSHRVAAGSYVIGDINIDGTVQHDWGDGEGTVAYFQKDALVEAPWGAGFLQGSIEFLDQKIRDEFAHGCGGTGCKTIRQVIVRPDGQQERTFPTPPPPAPADAMATASAACASSSATETMWREKAAEGTSKTYTRCPRGQVQYSIQVDDRFTAFNLICPGKPAQSFFNSLALNVERSQGQLLKTYDTPAFRVEPGCTVQFTIVNDIADQMGFTIWQEAIGP